MTVEGGVPVHCLNCDELQQLVEQYQREYDNIWRVLVTTLEGLAARVAVLEAQERMLVPVAPPLPPPIQDDDSLVRQKRASTLGGQIDTLQLRIKYLEDLLERPAAIASPPPLPKLPRSPDIDNELLRRLTEMVKFLTIRNNDLIRFMQDARPKYDPTYHNSKAARYDGNFPWLVGRKLAELEKENRTLREQQEITQQRHYDLVNRTDTLVAPVLRENAELRTKLDKYR